MIIYYIFILFIGLMYCFIKNKTKQNIKILIYEVEFCGLGNRLLGLSGSIILSLLSNRKLFIYYYEYLDNYIEKSKYFSIITSLKNKNYTNFKLSSDGYCGNFCDFYNKFINTKKKGLIIRSVFDLVPTMVKCTILKNWFIKNYFIKKNIKEKDVNILSLEINHIIFTKLILLKKNVENDVYNYIEPYKNRCKIGLQIRDDDGCVIYKNCKADEKVINSILKRVEKFNVNKSCWLFISSANKMITRAISLKYNRTIEYLPNINPTHSSILFNNNTYKKTIGDITFPSLTDYLIITDHSTYSKIILYKFFKNKYLNDFMFIFRNGDINKNEPLTELLDNVKTKECKNFPQL